MRSDGKHAKKQGSGISLFAKILLFVAVCVFLFLGGFVMWVFYGEEGDGKADTSQEQIPEEKKIIENVTVDVSKNWSVPNEAFKGSNGYGSFVSGNVKNKISLSKIFSEMGIDEDTNDPAEVWSLLSNQIMNRMEAVRLFVDGLYYEPSKKDSLSNGDRINVYIRSTEDPEEIEETAKIIINGLGEHKKVTVAGLTEKFTYGELAARKDLLDALVKTGKERVKKSKDGNKPEIFADEEKYNTEFTLYGMYFAQPQDKSCDDHMVLIYRIKSTYPDDNYVYWNKDGDLVFTYEMVHFSNINKETTVDDIKKGTVYDSFRYQDKASEVFQWYKDNLDDDTTYYLQQMSYQG